MHHTYHPTHRQCNQIQNRYSTNVKRKTDWPSARALAAIGRPLSAYCWIYVRFVVAQNPHRAYIASTSIARDRPANSGESSPQKVQRRYRVNAVTYSATNKITTNNVRNASLFFFLLLLMSCPPESPWRWQLCQKPIWLDGFRAISWTGRAKIFFFFK